MFKKILVAMDQSDICKHVFDQAIAFAKTYNATLLLIHVLSPVEEGYPGAVFPINSTYLTLSTEAWQRRIEEWKVLEEHGLTFLRSQADAATATGVLTEFTQAFGNPGYAICTVAKTWNANLIVIGRRGHSGLNEVFLGSVSNYVLHHAPCSVLIVQGVDAMEEA
jgi:nucleotide-binding universal stress UspA family protein